MISACRFIFYLRPKWKHSLIFPLCFSGPGWTDGKIDLNVSQLPPFNPKPLLMLMPPKHLFLLLLLFFLRGDISKLA